MDWLQFFAALIDSLAWPAAVAGSIFIFREKLVELLPRLRVKYKDAEVNFRLEQAEKEAEALPPPPEDAPEPTPEEKSRFEQVAEISPRAAMLEVRTEIEVAVRDLAKAANLLSPKVQSTLGLTRLLRSRGLIKPHTSALLDHLRVLGNDAAHDMGTEYSVDDALRYRELANRAITQLLQVQSIIDDDD